ncbi:MAG: hypothetical protein HYZ14_10875 [Bacteroidetes bacterium]|nr:hypothetical protein [Bacteroidota bacterium]
MKLGCKCPDCSTVNRISAFIAADRVELAKKKGAEFDLRCAVCGSNTKIHVDDVYAESDLTVLLAGIGSAILGVFLTIWFWNAGFIATASFAIPIVITAGVASHERTKIKLFNYGFYDSKRSRK